MLRFDPAALSGCALLIAVAASPVSAEPRPARGGHLLGPDMAALATPPRLAPTRPARGGHLLGPDMAAARKPIAPRAAAAPVCATGAPCDGTAVADK